jgi:hypothetical protein
LVAAMTRTLTVDRPGIRDLVEEEHASEGQFNLARLRLLGASERSALESEEFGLEELLRQRRAIDRDERAAPSRRPLVDEPRDDFLAGARLALKARRRFGRCHLRRALAHVTPRMDVPMGASICRPASIDEIGRRVVVCPDTIAGSHVA